MSQPGWAIGRQRLPGLMPKAGFMTTPDDHVRDACGVVGVYSRNLDVAKAAFDGLYSLQHRGQESAGIATGDGDRIRVHTSMGLVSQAFDEEDLIRLPGHIAIGHTRYSTSGSSHIRNAQPVLAHGPDVELALGHNGNVVNAVELREELVSWGCEFATTSDSELVAHVLSCAPGESGPIASRTACAGSREPTPSWS